MHHQFTSPKLSLDSCSLGFKPKNIHIKLDHQNSWISNQLCGMDVMDVTLVYDFWSLLPHLLKFRLPDDWIFESVTSATRTGPLADVVRTPLASWHAPGELGLCLAKGDISFP